MNDFLKKFLCLYISITLAVVTGLAIDRYWQTRSFFNTSATNNNIPEAYVPPQVAPPDECLADQSKFCAGVAGVFNMSECLYRNHQTIKKSCLNQLQSKQKSLLSCSQDIEKKCNGMTIMDFKVMTCLKEHKKDLSSGCLGLINL